MPPSPPPPRRGPLSLLFYALSFALDRPRASSWCSCRCTNESAKRSPGVSRSRDFHARAPPPSSLFLPSLSLSFSLSPFPSSLNAGLWHSPEIWPSAVFPFLRHFCRFYTPLNIFYRRAIGKSPDAQIETKSLKAFRTSFLPDIIKCS